MKTKIRHSEVRTWTVGALVLLSVSWISGKHSVDENGECRPSSSSATISNATKQMFIRFIILTKKQMFRNDHTTVTIPLPVCSAKSSTVGPG